MNLFANDFFFFDIYSNETCVDGLNGAEVDIVGTFDASVVPHEMEQAWYSAPGNIANLFQIS